MSRLASPPTPPPARSSLGVYHGKRDFSTTPEPRGGMRTVHRGRAAGFVVQKHAASHLHYDFRLEVAGALKSWAVPKGIPVRKGERRLAVKVEDHPLGYARFEGTIPKGQYGGGTVMLWDRGTFTCPSSRPRKDLDQGRLHVVLHGQKLHGEWALVRLRDEKNWLLIRLGASNRPIPGAADDRSVATGRSMREIALHKASKRRAEPAAKRPALSGQKRNRKAPGVRRPALPTFIEPMLAKLVESPPNSGRWRYEAKFDGYRVLARKQGAEVSLISRTGLPLAQRFPSIAAAVAELPVETAMIDGEVVAVDARGRANFGALHGEDHSSLLYYAFDLPWVDGRDLRNAPLEDRRRELARIVAGATGTIRFSSELKGAPDLLLESARKAGLEGLVAKRAGSLYEAGRRSGAWVKLKCLQQQEFVIGGFTAPRGSRPHLGALVVGYYAGRKLRYAGKVGTGFGDDTRALLLAKLSPLIVGRPLFVDPDPSLRGVRWVRPSVVCQVKFTEWTGDGRLRHPVYLGLREDRRASGVRRETPARPPR